MIYVIHTAPDGSKSFRSYAGQSTAQVEALSAAYPGTFKLVDEETWQAAVAEAAADAD